MTQDIQKEIQDLSVNYKNRVIRMSTDYQVVTIGRLQIENLDWKWEPAWSDKLGVYMEFDPYDWMSASPIDSHRGNFVVTKYGLSYREKPLTLGAYKPLYGWDAKPDEIARIMGQEMGRMKKEGAKKCENGIEIVPESPSWNTVDRLATRARNTFRTLLGEKVKCLEAGHVQYNVEKIWNDGIGVTRDIVALAKQLGVQIAR